jgi:hypothetical protein
MNALLIVVLLLLLVGLSYYLYKRWRSMKPKRLSAQQCAQLRAACAQSQDPEGHAMRLLRAWGLDADDYKVHGKFSCAKAVGMLGCQVPVPISPSSGSGSGHGSGHGSSH